VYFYLSHVSDQDGYAFPFVRTIAARTHLSKATVGHAQVGEDSFDVGVSLAHLAFHGAGIKDLSGFIVVDLPGYVDRVANLHRLGIAVTRFPPHPHIEDLFLDSHVLTPLQVPFFDHPRKRRLEKSDKIARVALQGW
jgi:hypothetical protein